MWHPDPVHTENLPAVNGRDANRVSEEVSSRMQLPANPVSRIIGTTSLPSEVVDYIVEILAHRNHYEPGDVLDLGSLTPAVEVSRRELGALSLTCRYWAIRCRPHLFKKTTIRSIADLGTLIQTLKHFTIDGLPSVSDCLHSVDVLQSGAWTLPWLHHVQSRLSEASASRLSLSLILNDTYMDDNTSASHIARFAPRSLSANLPRTIPGENYHFQSLELTNLRFRRVADLLSLLHHITVVQDVTCHNVQFQDAIIPLPRNAQRAPERELFIVTISSCGEARFEVDLVFTILSTKSAKRCRLEAEAWKGISDIILSLFPSGKGWRKRLAVLTINEGMRSLPQLLTSLLAERSNKMYCRN